MGCKSYVVMFVFVTDFSSEDIELQFYAEWINKRSDLDVPMSASSNKNIY